MEYLSISQTAQKWGISTRRIQTLCATGRLDGAIKIGSYWAIPADLNKPEDKRKNNGKYVRKGKGDRIQ